MAKDGIDLLQLKFIIYQLNIIKNNIFNELFNKPRQYMIQENPIDDKFNIKLL